MKVQKTPVALAALALCAAAPFAAAAPSVSFTSPQAGATISKNSASTCAATASGASRVVFSLVSSSGAVKPLNTDSSSPYNCSFNSYHYADGNWTLRAVAYDSAGATATATRNITINNNGTVTPPPPTPNPKPVVSVTSPANGASVAAGSPVSCAATASDADGIKQVQWYLDGRLVTTDTTPPFNTCNISSLSAGSHVIKAVATDTKGATGEAQVTVTAASTPPSNPKPVVSFTKPANNTNVAVGSAVSCTVNATDADGITQVQWFLDGNLVNTEKLAPYDTCSVYKLAAGAHVIKAVATDSKGATGEAQVTITAGTGGGNTNPTVGISAPSTGATLTGKTVPYTATATDSGGISKVDMYLVSGAQQKLVDTKTAAPFQGTIDSTVVPNGAAKLMAVATDTQGAQATMQRDVMVSNTNPDPDPNPGPGTGTTLPSTNTQAIATFESLGLYWSPGSNPGAAGCQVRYRKKSETAWKEGFPMWYDSRNSECRSSLVHLSPGTDYVVELGLPGQAFSRGINTRTWSENFPIAQTIQVASGSAQLNITAGGTPSGYVLYTGPATLDGQNSALHNIEVSAPYVIIRGLTLKGAKSHAIRLQPGTHDVVIEDNDISEWGLPDANGYTTAEGWKVGKDGESAVKANCTSSWLLERTIIQRNKIHHPRYGSNSWSEGHPKGPNGVHFHECGGNHVFRYNEVYSETGRYFMDGYGGAENFGTKGMPNSDSDLYGNIITHSWDDAIEAEGNNRNVRIWGNYFDNTMTGVATTSVAAGPIYIWRNVQNRQRTYSNRTLDNDQRNYTFKSGDSGGFGGGRRYVFHNTMLQATQSGASYPLGGGSGLAGPTSSAPLSNTVSRNNMFHIWKSHWSAFDTKGGANNSLDYDMTNGNLTANTYAGAETNGMVGTPTYAAGHGWQSESGGNYHLAPGSSGYDRGARLPNFNDGFTGSAPDVGAHEAGTAAMKFGVGGNSSWVPATAGTSPSTTTTTSAITGGTPAGAGSGGGVCSTIVCAAQ